MPINKHTIHTEQATLTNKEELSELCMYHQVQLIIKIYNNNKLQKYGQHYH